MFCLLSSCILLGMRTCDWSTPALLSLCLYLVHLGSRRLTQFVSSGSALCMHTLPTPRLRLCACQLVTERPMGVSMCSRGTLDVFLHRSISNNDGRGITAPAIDSSRTTVTIWLVWGDANAVHATAAKLALQLQSPLMPFFVSCAQKGDAFRKAAAVSTGTGTAETAATAVAAGTKSAENRLRAASAALSGPNSSLCCPAQWALSRATSYSAMAAPLPWPALVTVQRFTEQSPESAILHVQYACTEADCRMQPLVSTLRASFPMLQTAILTEVGLNGQAAKAGSPGGSTSSNGARKGGSGATAKTLSRVHSERQVEQPAGVSTQRPLAPWVGEGGMQLRTFRAVFDRDEAQTPKSSSSTNRERILTASQAMHRPWFTASHATALAGLCFAIAAVLQGVKHCDPRWHTSFSGEYRLVSSQI
eukprot:6180616-Pleurochrysis_carterae.AAC.2